MNRPNYVEMMMDDLGLEYDKKFYIVGFDDEDFGPYTIREQDSLGVSEEIAWGLLTGRLLPVDHISDKYMGAYNLSSWEADAYPVVTEESTVHCKDCRFFVDDFSVGEDYGRCLLRKRNIYIGPYKYCDKSRRAKKELIPHPKTIVKWEDSCAVPNEIIKKYGIKDPADIRE